MVAIAFKWAGSPFLLALAVFSYEEAMEMMKLTAKMRFLQALQENAQYLNMPSNEELAEANRLINEERETIYQNSK